jgi:hypothetical protein
MKMQAADFLKMMVTLYKPTCFSILESGHLQRLMMFREKSKGNRPQYLELKQVKGSWRKLCIYQLHNLYFLPYITRVKREMGGTCSLNGVNHKCLQNCGHKKLRIEISWCSLDGNIKMDD